MKSTVEVTAVSARQPEANPPDLDLEQKIRLRAYELYEQRNRGNGYDQEDWLDAEAELRAKSELRTTTVAA